MGLINFWTHRSIYTSENQNLKFNLSSVTDLNSKPCANDLLDKATVDSQFSAVKLQNKEHPRRRFLEVDRNFHEVILPIARKRTNWAMSGG